MKLTNSDSNTIKLHFKGRIDSVTSPDFEKEVQEAIDKSPNQIILDFEEVDYISSAALRILLYTSKQCEAKEISLAIANMNKIVREVIELTGFSSLFRFI